MNSTLRQFRDFFVSLQLTVWLLILSLILVFVATLDQVNLGIWAVQEKYFRSFAVLWQIPDTQIGIPVFPGGYFIGGLLLINLISAHVYRFSFTWKKTGIQLAHAGIIILLIGELLTGLLQEESFMRMDQGETKRYSESFHENELVFINHSVADATEVVAIPEALVADKKSIQHPRLPFQVNVKEFYPNSTLQMRAQAMPAAGAPVATAGFGAQLAMTPLRITYKPNERNVPGAFVELVATEGNLGVWLASPLLNQPQTFTAGGQTWEIAFRQKRVYKPFTLTLLKFSHDKYPGTEIPKNFSSRVRVKSDDGTDDREVLIFMNNPLRYGGLTFYQAGFDNNDTTTILQVVRNPGWLLPYIACIMMGVGLCIQFGLSLAGFIRKRTAATAAAVKATESAAAPELTSVR
ncbi:MAG: ResB protein required for cytochrome C biosynthesis [Opitutus sp.]|nr:ResB protein required for cytochrome C biosynthesis [Opitutus sp.]